MRLGDYFQFSANLGYSEGAKPQELVDSSRFPWRCLQHMCPGGGREVAKSTGRGHMVWTWHFGAMCVV